MQNEKNGHGKNGKSILVVEDDINLRLALEDMLSGAGLDVMTAANGQEALTIFQERQPHIGLIILDVNMRGMRGDTVFYRLREIDPQLNVIISSSYNQAEIDHMFGDSRSYDYLRKPYGAEILLDHVKESIGNVAA